MVRPLAVQCAEGVPDGWTGRKLGRYLRETGLEPARLEPATIVLHDLSTVLRAMNPGPFLEADRVRARHAGRGARAP